MEWTKWTAPKIFSSRERHLPVEGLRVSDIGQHRLVSVIHGAEKIK